MTRSHLTALVLAGGVLVIGAGASRAGQPAPPACYARKATWQETLLASYGALTGQERAAEKRLAEEKASDPALRAFQPLTIEVKGRQEPRRVRVRIAGLKELYVGAEGRHRLYGGDPRLIERDGNAVPFQVGRSRLLGRRWCHHDGSGSWRPVELGERTFEKGFQIQDTEIVVELDGRYEWFEVHVGSRDRDDREPQRFWVDWRSVFDRRERSEKARGEIWLQVAEDFADLRARRERALEAARGIWQEDFRPKRPSELALRYARACAGPQRAAALKLAESAGTCEDLQRVRDLYYLQFVGPRLELARRTLRFVGGGGARGGDPARELAALERRAADAATREAAGAQALHADICNLRRRIILSHPALDFEELLINQRTCHVPSHMCDQYLGVHSRPGAGLAILESWKDGPQVRHLLKDKLPAGMTYHPDLSFDAKRVLFAFCPTGEKYRAFFLYEAAIDGSWVRQLTGTRSDPLKGHDGRRSVLIEDYDPCYLPDGGIAFISTRSQQFGRCHGSRYVPSYVLYRADADGSNIRRLSQNEANEWNPSVLHDGRIIYCRWDYINRHDTVFQSLWAMHPDGTGTAHYYGNYSRRPCMITEARAIPHSGKTVATGTNHHGYTVGTILVVDPLNGEDEGEPLLCVTPELPCPEGGLPRETALAAEPLPGDVPAVPSRSQTWSRRWLRPQAASPFPISEDLFLVAYAHEEQYAIYLVDTLGGRELIYHDPTVSCFNPIPLRPTPRPPVLASALPGGGREATGRFYVQDVYESTQPIERGTIRRLRVNRIFPQPTRSKPTLSAVNNEIIKRTLGTAEVHERGSVAFEAPANTPLQFQLLDANGLAVMTMRSLVYLQPGETAGCVGCHEPRSSSPAFTGRFVVPRFQKLQPPPGCRYEGGFSFVRTVQPVLDRYCIKCHGLGKTEGGVNLLGQRSGRFTASYDSLMDRSRRLVRIAQRNSESTYSRPKDYFAHAGKLAGMMLEGHKDKSGKPCVRLDAESLQRIINWLDLNAQFYGDYSFNRIEEQAPSAEGEKALRSAIEKRFGAELAGQPYAALVNVALPTESRILKAPLAEQAGGWGQIAAGGWASADEASCREMRRLVEASIAPPKYHDVAGTCGRDKGCRCGGCRYRLFYEANEQAGR